MTPTPVAITLRPARRDDVEMILWLEEVAMKDYAVALWGDWRSSDTAETVDVSVHEMVVAGDSSIGCIATRVDAEALSLLRLYLAPDVRSKGIGATVLRQIKQRADDIRLPVRLRVLANNPARRFYTRHGFETEDQTPDHIYMVYHGPTFSREDTAVENH
ncbi:GNAT family N-acetyltransferase [Yoonia sp. 208BN28-4]|uniref:GNAT family N-acetyltransferase n=1 Tax=Yoonia sp. 208BN28-4 TaxID=3126505 RepID=UPI0030A07B25